VNRWFWIVGVMLWGCSERIHTFSLADTGIGFDAAMLADAGETLDSFRPFSVDASTPEDAAEPQDVAEFPDVSTTEEPQDATSPTDAGPAIDAPL
jgi:hypothetical protein